MTAMQGVKNVAKKASRDVKKTFSQQSPVERVQDVAGQADETIRHFAKTQPVMALVLALTAGYVVGRAVARLT